MGDTYPMPPDGWVCFHCGERFTTPGAAEDHFGETPESDPACVLKIQVGGERGLIMALRKAESQNRRLQDELEQAEHMVSVRTHGYHRIGGAKDEYEAFCNYDTMEGRVIAAEALVADIAKRWPALVEASRRRICQRVAPGEE